MMSFMTVFFVPKNEHERKVYPHMRFFFYMYIMCLWLLKSL